nr:hypothetical protein Iba_chr13fCG7180 [Ipomoea batatas]
MASAEITTEIEGGGGEATHSLRPALDTTSLANKNHLGDIMNLLPCQYECSSLRNDSEMRSFKTIPESVIMLRPNPPCNCLYDARSLWKEIGRERDNIELSPASFGEVAVHEQMSSRLSMFSVEYTKRVHINFLDNEVISSGEYILTDLPHKGFDFWWNRQPPNVSPAHCKSISEITPKSSVSTLNCIQPFVLLSPNKLICVTPQWNRDTHNLVSISRLKNIINQLNIPVATLHIQKGVDLCLSQVFRHRIMIN